MPRTPPKIAKTATAMPTFRSRSILVRSSMGLMPLACNSLHTTPRTWLRRLVSLFAIDESAGKTWERGRIGVVSSSGKLCYPPPPVRATPRAATSCQALRVCPAEMACRRNARSKLLSRRSGELAKQEVRQSQADRDTV